MSQEGGGQAQPRVLAGHTGRHQDSLPDQRPREPRQPNCAEKVQPRRRIVSLEYWKTVAENAKKPKHFRVEDRVKSNQADGDILRDEEGTIVRWLWKDNEGSGALVRFDSGSLELMERPGDIDLAYATTIHKGQGGEFLNVLVVLCNIPVSQSSESVYTGISRAKQWCALLYPNEKILKLARTRRLERWTKLRAYLNKRSVDLKNFLIILFFSFEVKRERTTFDSFPTVHSSSGSYVLMFFTTHWYWLWTSFFGCGVWVPSPFERLSGHCRCQFSRM